MIVAAGAAGLAEGPRPVGAAEPSPTDGTSTAEATTPKAQADCDRGDNLGFDTPPVTTVNGRWIHESDVPAWDTDSVNDYIGIAPNDHWESLDRTQYAQVPKATLSQSFPTLQGDVIAWTLHHGSQAENHQTDLLFGVAGSLETVRELISQTDWEWKRHHGFYTVPHGGDDTALSQTVLSLKGVGSISVSYVNAIKLAVRCGISITARVVGFTDNDDSGTVTAHDAIELAYDVRNTAAAVEDAADPEKHNRGAASLTNVDVAHNLADTEIDCPEAKTKLLKPTVSGSTDHQMTCAAVYELTQPDIDRGIVTAVATVDAVDAVRAAGEADPTKPLDHRVRDSASVTTAEIEANPLLTVEKKMPVVNDAAARPAGRVDAGDTVSYSFKVANDGNVTLDSVSLRIPGAEPAPCPKRTLAPKASTTCTAVYTVTSADIAAGAIKSTATVTARAPDKTTVTATDSVSVSTDPGKSTSTSPSKSTSTDPGKSTVDRIAGKDRHSTAALISQKTFAPGVETAYIATGVDFRDALAGSAASGGDGPILLVAKDSIPGATLTELRRLKPKRIVVLGGTGAVSKAVESTLKKEATTTRQAGADRYSTAAAISAKHFDAGVDVAFVATGEDFPDALAGGPAAAALGGPILLTQKTKLPAATIAELKRLKPKRIVVVGGTGVVSEAVQNALAGYTTGKVSRQAGADRYATGGKISENAFESGVPVAYIATGLNFPDALAGGAAGAFQDGPVLLVAGATIPKATKDELGRLKPKRIVVLGGTAVVPKTVRDALGAYLPKTP